MRKRHGQVRPEMECALPLFFNLYIELVIRARNGCSKSLIPSRILRRRDR